MPDCSEEHKQLEAMQVEYVLAKRRKPDHDHSHKLREIVSLACKLGKHSYCHKNSACRSKS